MIKKETILSVFDKKLTLLEYLKEIKKGLEDSAIESFSCDQVDETHVKFALNFADGTSYETDAIEVPTGPQGETGATPQIEVSVSAETLAPNESATASVTQGGTAEAPTIAIAFGIPKGEQGEAGEGAKMYLHAITSNLGAVNIITSDNTPFTQATLAKWLYDNGFRSHATGYPTCALKLTAVNNIDLLTNLGAYNVNSIAWYGYNIFTANETYPNFTLTTDVVIEL